ncbi:FadR family transcriptional regulator [Nocardioides agariphilus]|uniref:FadR family transcriptional regulator n=1 Tax=Nocardioides agariphilus TaxID=433664 RepID=A0A930VEV0_9ACTN|nr:FadR family transcriptional regulator [Nocardioides agariphilus]
MTSSPEHAATGLPVTAVRPVYEQVADQLRGLLVSGDLVHGQRLPSEGELAKMFGVGRTTVREGLRILASQQLLVTTRGAKGGTFVVTPDADTVSRYLETSIGLLAGADRMSIGELLEARKSLEVPATRMATERADAAGLVAIGAAARPVARSGATMEHSNFHVEVLAASGNRMLEVMARPIFDVMRMRLNRGAAPADFWGRVEAEHQEVFASIEARDPDGAMAAMEAHLDHLFEVYVAIDWSGQRIASVEGGRDLP